MPPLSHAAGRNISFISLQQAPPRPHRPPAPAVSLNDYLATTEAHGQVEAHFSLRYFNSSSTKLIRSLSALLHDAVQADKRIVAHWYHDPDDDVMSEFGNDLKDEFRMLDIRVVALATA